MRVNRLVLVTITAGMFAALSGCTLMDKSYRGMTGMTNPDKMKLKGGIEWMAPQPALREVSPDKQVVYLRLRNTSGSPLEMAPLQDRVRVGIESAGYRVTTNVNEAQFTVNADVRYCGDASKKEMGLGAAATTAVAGVGGAVAGHAIGGNDTGTVLGAAGGAAIGYGLASILANRNKMVQYDMVVDVRLGERVGNVETTRRTDTETKVASASSRTVAGEGQSPGGLKGLVGNATTGGGTTTSAGSGSAGSTQTQEVRMQDQFLYHENRLTANVMKMALTPEEAMPFLSDKIATALSSLLP